MTGKKNSPPNLIISRDKAKAKIETQILEGQNLLSAPINNLDDLNEAKNKLSKWSDYNRELIQRLFDNDSITTEYERIDLGVGHIINPSVDYRVGQLKLKIQRRITILESIVKRLELIPEDKSLNNNEKVVAEKKSQPNEKVIWIVHGRNLKIRDSMFQFIRAIGVTPLEWGEAKVKTKKTSPFVGEILDVAFSYAQAVIVLLTGDDLARLKEEFLSPEDEQYEIEPTPQARPNVLFEAGMAFGYRPERTILVQIGKIRPFSDIAGRHIIKFDGGPEKRKELIDALATAGVLTDIAGKKEWLTAGDFTLEVDKPAKKTEEKIMEEFANIKKAILYTVDVGNLYPNLKKLRNLFIKHDEIFRKGVIAIFFNKWLNDPLVERGESMIGVWINPAVVSKMKDDLSGLEI